MMNIKIILLLSLASYVTCGGGHFPPIGDGAKEVFSDDEQCYLLKEEKPLSKDTNDELYDTVMPLSEDTDDEFHDALMTHGSGAIENVQDSFKGKPQNFTKLPNEETINANNHDQGVEDSGLHPSSSNINVGPTINIGHPGSIQCNNSGVIYGGVTVNLKAGTSEEMSVDEGSRSSKPCDPLSEEDDYDDDDADDDYDDDDEEQGTGQSTYVSASASGSMTSNIQGKNGVQHNNTGYQYRPVFNFGDFEPQPPAESAEQSTGQSSCVSGGDLGSMTYNSQGKNGVQHVNTGTQYRPVFNFSDFDDEYNTLNGSRIVFQGETLLIGGHKIQGVNAKKRPLVLTWGGDKLYVNGIYQRAFDGIEGRGTWRF